MINYELVKWIGLVIMGTMMIYTAYKFHQEDKQLSEKYLSKKNS